MSSLLTVDQVAKVLLVGKQRVYALCRLGILPHIRLGRSVRFDASQLESFMNSGGRSFPGGWRKDSDA